MKRNALIVMVVLSALNLQAQFKAGNSIVSLNGNYSKNNNESGVLSNSNSTNGQYLNVGTSFGYFITDNVIVGIGLDYNLRKETRSNFLFFNSFLQQELMDLKSRIWLPTVHVGYYKHVFRKLYFNTNLKFGYGKIKSDVYSARAGVSLSNSSTVSINDNGIINAEISGQYENKYFGVQLNPEFTYFVSPKLGLCLGLGGVDYSILDGKKENSSWNVNFNPSFWNLGIKIKLN
jgi:hypothetical protein